MARPALVPAVTLIEDLSFYPRDHIDEINVSDMVQALKAGYKLPPVIAERNSKRLVDGWHRRRATLRHFGEQAEIEVFWREYANEADLYADAVEANSAHGRKFSNYDRVRITIRGRELGLPPSRIGVLLHRTEEEIERLSIQVAQTGSGDTIALKRPLRRLAGTTLTAPQERVNKISSGWSVGFHAQQLIEHLEGQTVNLTPDLLIILIRLRDLLTGLDLVSEGED